MTFFREWMKRWQERNAHAVGYRFGDAPTADEVAAQAAEHARWSERENALRAAIASDFRWPCHSRPKGEWCAREGPGGFIAHTCRRPDEDEVAAPAVWTIRYEQRSPDCGLTVAQHARLAELIEECGEVVQAAAKVLQCGYDERSRHGKGMPRRVLLERELGHLEASLSVLYGSGDARRSQVRVWKERRLGVRHASPAAAPTLRQESEASQ
jgi:hypothetical protein